MRYCLVVVINRNKFDCFFSSYMSFDAVGSLNEPKGLGDDGKARVPRLRMQVHSN